LPNGTASPLRLARDLLSAKHANAGELEANPMCFGLVWLENLIIWVIVICCVIALLRLLVSFELPPIGLGAEILGFIIKAITIVIWAIVCIALVIFVFDLIGCVLGGGVGFPRMVR
jgi:hypothetical protein